MSTTKCPHGTCDKRLHAATGALACDLMCRRFDDLDARHRVDALEADVARFSARARAALAGRGPEEVAAWFRDMGRDLRTCLPTGYDLDEEDYTSGQVPAPVHLTSPELALRAAVVLATTGGTAALDVLRQLALFDGAVRVVRFEDGEYRTHRHEHEREYHLVPEAAWVYLHMCLLTGGLERALQELQGPLAAEAVHVLQLEGSPPSYGTDGRARLLSVLSRSVPALPEPPLRRPEVRRAIADHLAAHLDAHGSLEFFVRYPDLAPVPRLVELAAGPAVHVYTRGRALEVLRLVIAAGGARGRAAAETLAGGARALLATPSDPVLPDLAAALPAGPGRAAFVQALVERLAAGPPAAELERLVALAHGLRGPDLEARARELLATGRLEGARALAEFLGPQGAAQLVEAEVAAAIKRLAGAWPERRKAIDALLEACADSAAARRALREHAAREQDYDLGRVLQREARRFAAP